MISCIYIIKSTIKPERFYIGSAVSLARREANHICLLNKNKHGSRLLQRHVNKYGIEDIYFEILEIVPDKNNLIVREQYFLDAEKPFFNTCKIAGSTLGRIPSLETKQKLRECNLGKMQSEETIKKRVATGLRTGSTERMRQTKLGTKLTDEHKQKISISGKGKTHAHHTQKKRTAEHSLNISKGTIGKKLGVKLSDEHKANIGKGLLAFNENLKLKSWVS